MATIDNKSLINEIIANNGYYSDDTRVAKIVEYTNAFGNITWGVTWISESISSQNKYLVPTPYVRNPKVIWKAE